VVTREGERETGSAGLDARGLTAGPGPTVSRVHTPELQNRVFRLIDEGHRDREIANRVGLPRSTVNYIRHTRYARPIHPVCPRCWRRGRTVELSPTDYAELLGLYLGDGCISRAGRVHRLRLCLDTRYPQILEESRSLLARSFPHSSVGAVSADHGATITLSVYSSHLPCLFPQHGPGKKHDRSLVLEEWQERLIELAPWAFLRGCIRSDGCTFITFINTTGPYRYLTYDFCNYSADIRAMFTWACGLVGRRYRATGNRVRINRRESVARLVQHVGVKA
jgi:hypothetical protein